MTDKEQIKAIIKQYADKGKRLYAESYNEKKDEYAIGFWDGYKSCADGLLRELDDMQEEPTTSVWHDAKVKPLDGKDVLLEFKSSRLHIITTYDGDDYCINAFWIKFSEQKRWAYVKDLLKL